MNRSSKRFVFFKNNLFRSYIRVCFQVLAGNRPVYKNVSLGAPFTWLCATYVLRRKQQAGNIHVRKNEINLF